MKAKNTEKFIPQQKQKQPLLLSVKVAASKMTKGGEGKFPEAFSEPIQGGPNFYG